jgi:hypothetical protein
MGSPVYFSRFQIFFVDIVGSASPLLCRGPAVKAFMVITRFFGTRFRYGILHINQGKVPIFFVPLSGFSPRLWRAQPLCMQRQDMLVT